MSATLIVAIAGWFVGWLLLPRLHRCSRERAAANGKPIAISVIVPARDEAENLPRLLQSLNEQTRAPLEVIVADDQSSDNTAEIARGWGATVVIVANRPVGVVGKSWGCWSAAQHAQGDVLVFLDADTWLSPTGLECLWATFTDYRGLLTVQPYHAVTDWHEQLAAMLNTMVVLGVKAFSWGSRGETVQGGFGPCVVCAREKYLALGGHQVSGHMRIEAFPLAAHFHRSGEPVRALLGEEVVQFRMYPGNLAQQVRGWSKFFALGAQGIPLLALLGSVLWVSGAFSAAQLLVLHADRGTLSLMAYALYALQFARYFRAVGRFHWITAMLFPVPLIFFVFTYLHSLVSIKLLKRSRWKGRNIVEQP